MRRSCQSGRLHKINQIEIVKSLIKTIFFLGFSIHAFSQEKFMDRFTLRQSFQSKNDLAEPALFTFTKPKNKEASWLINAAIGYNFLINTNTVISLDPYFEYHKNTLIDKIQDNWQFGITSEWQSSDLAQKSWTPIFISAIKFNNDQTKGNTSFQGNIYFTPLFKGRAKNPKYFWIPNIISDFGRAFQFTYSPYLGIENENRILTTEDSSSGNIYRLMFRVSSSIKLFPKSKKLKGKFDLNLDWQYRNNFSKNVKNLNTKEPMFMTANFNYVFFTSDDEKKSAKIGFDYTQGDNPTRNFEKQSFYAVSLKIKM